MLLHLKVRVHDQLRNNACKRINFTDLKYKRPDPTVPFKAKSNGKFLG